MNRLREELFSLPLGERRLIRFPSVLLRRLVRDAALRELAFQPLMPIETHLDRIGEIGADRWLNQRGINPSGSAARPELERTNEIVTTANRPAQIRVRRSASKAAERHAVHLVDHKRALRRSRCSSRHHGRRLEISRRDRGLRIQGLRNKP